MGGVLNRGLVFFQYASMREPTSPGSGELRCVDAASPCSEVAPSFCPGSDTPSAPFTCPSPDSASVLMVWYALFSTGVRFQGADHKQLFEARK